MRPAMGGEYASATAPIDAVVIQFIVPLAALLIGGGPGALPLFTGGGPDAQALIMSGGPGALPLCLQSPVSGEATAPFAPTGRYSGHWGLDFAAEPGTSVRAAGPGVVTFAGSVAGMLTVTIDHSGGFRSSVSYLESIAVSEGDRLNTGAIVGRSGQAHGRNQLHFSLRVHGEYIDPAPYLACSSGSESKLYLLPPPGRSYPRSRAQRPTRGNVRPTPHRPSLGGRSGIPSAEP